MLPAQTNEIPPINTYLQLQGKLWHSEPAVMLQAGEAGSTLNIYVFCCSFGGRRQQQLLALALPTRTKEGELSGSKHLRLAILKLKVAQDPSHALVF